MAECPRNKFLVFSSVGDQNQVGRWICKERGYDIAIVYYGDSEFELRDSVEYFIRNKDLKIPNFLKCVWDFEGLLDYDYYLFVDDDIILDPATVEGVFKAAVDYDLELCQPSYSEDSVTYWPQLKHKDGIEVEFTNFVEVGCFCASKRLLQKALPYFSFIKSGFALDLILSELLGYPKNKIAILHHLQINHPYKDERLRVVYLTPGLGAMNAKADKILRFCLGRNRQGKTLLSDFTFQSYGTINQAGRYKQNRFHEARWKRLRRAKDALKRALSRRAHKVWQSILGKVPVSFQFNRTKNEIKLLFEHLSPEKDYLEYGTGRNTVEIAKRVRKVMSVEHDPYWHAVISKEVGANVGILLRPISRPHVEFRLGGANWNLLEFDKFLEKDGSQELFKDYIEAVKDGKFDVILVDGRARLYCLEYVRNHGLLKPGGVLFLHDYDRKWLSMAELWFKKVQCVDRLAMFKSYEEED